jgi:hypothetical protein
MRGENPQINSMAEDSALFRGNFLKALRGGVLEAAALGGGKVVAMGMGFGHGAGAWCDAAVHLCQVL